MRDAPQRRPPTGLQSLGWLTHKNKAPCRPDGRRIAWKEASSWLSYDQAQAAPHVDGFGVVLTKNARIACVDIDQCITDGEVHPEARRLCDRLGGYCEVSMSGTGLHVFVRATKLPGDRCKATRTQWGGALEVYDRDRFIVVTLNGDGELCEAQGALDDLLVAYGLRSLKANSEPNDVAEAVRLPHTRRQGGSVTKAAKGESKGPPAACGPDGVPVLSGTRLTDNQVVEKFCRMDRGRMRPLWDGDWTHYRSRSEADLAMASRLAYLTCRNTAQTERVMRRSGLRRQKWDRGDDYLQRTIRKAARNQRAVYDGGSGESGPRDLILPVVAVRPITVGMFVQTLRTALVDREQRGGHTVDQPFGVSFRYLERALGISRRQVGNLLHCAEELGVLRRVGEAPPAKAHHRPLPLYALAPIEEAFDRLTSDYVSLTTPTPLLCTSCHSLRLCGTYCGSAGL